MKNNLKRIGNFVLSSFLSLIILLAPFFNETTLLIDKQDYEAPAYTTDFINSIVGYAQDQMEETGLYASITIAQAIIETGWGKTGITKINNYFGMTEGSPCSINGEIKNVTGNGVWGGTLVCMSSSRRKVYRYAYADVESSFKDRARNLYCNPNYYSAVTSAKGMEAQMKALQASPWAGGGYPDMPQIIRDYNLTQYDNGITYSGGLPDYINCNATGGDPFTGTLTDITTDEGLGYYSSIDTDYVGDITQGYIYKTYSPSPLWDELLDENDESKVNHIIGNIFLQGEKLYGDGELHFDGLVTNGSDKNGPGGVITGSFSGAPLPAGTYTCTSGFGYRGNIGLAGASKNHKALDLAAVVGTTVFTVGDGVVTHAGWLGTCGLAIKVNHANGMQSRYCHLSAVNVSNGQSVTEGDVIGLSGNTGNSTGPHLDFQITVNGTAVDPRNVVSGLNGLKCSNGL